MNQNSPTDSEDRPIVAIGSSTIVLEVKAADGAPVDMNVTVGGDDVAPENPLPVAIVNTVTIEFDDPQHVIVDNQPGDPANGTNQTTANGRLLDIKTAVESISTRLPPALVNGTLVVTEANSTLVLAEVQAIADNVAPTTSSPVNFVASATTSPAALASHAGRRVLVVAEVANTAAVRVGGSSTSTTVGVPLYPGGSREYEASNSALIYACAVTGTQALNVEVIP